MTGSIVITGASSGFGQASARRFAVAGKKLVLAARRIGRINELVDELSSQTDCIGIELDVRDRKAVSKTFSSLPRPFSDIEVLVNNAGLALGLEGGDEVDLDHWDTMVDTNIKGLMYCTRTILPKLVSRGGGHIVNLGSVAGSWPYPGGNAYGATKAFVQQFSRNLRTDLLGKNIRVTCLEPGMCETEFSLVRFEGDKRKSDAVYDGMTPLSAVDVAEIIFFITSLPSHININQLEVMPLNQAWSPFAVHRES